MGQGLSCTWSRQENEFFGAVQAGDVEMIESLLEAEPGLLQKTTVYDRLSPLHIAAANGRIEVELCSLFLCHDVVSSGVAFCRSRVRGTLDDGFVLHGQVLSLILDRSVHPDLLNRYKQVMVHQILGIL